MFFPYNKNIKVSVYPKPIKIFLIILYLKINKFLNTGNIIPKFIQLMATFLINFIDRSITDDFRFRVEFLNNNAPTGFFFDFDVTMQKNFQTGNTH